MLVLSRRFQETIKFPQLDITIEILRIKGKSVRVGVDAPVEIKVVRGELFDENRTDLKRLLISAEDEHKIRNQLNTLTIASATAKRFLSKGEVSLAATTLDSAISQLENDVVEETVAEENANALLIEDMSNERELLAGFLRLHGFSVNTAKDGVEALEYLEENEKPDFLLMDMNLPRLDGASAIRKIRDNPAFDTVKIFAVSGQSAQQSG